MHCSHWGHDGHLAICFQVRKKPGKSMHRPGISVNCAVPVCRRDSNSDESIDSYIWLPELDTLRTSDNKTLEGTLRPLRLKTRTHRPPTPCRTRAVKPKDLPQDKPGPYPWPVPR